MDGNWLSIISIVITSVGLIGVYIQIRNLSHSLHSATHAKLCDQSFELIRLLAEKPETYDYFYNGKVLTERSKNRVFILYAAEAIANFLEHLILQKGNLPKKQWEVWDRFIVGTCESSVVVREFILQHRDWYSDELVRKIDLFEKQSVTPNEKEKSF